MNETTTQTIQTECPGCGGAVSFERAPLNGEVVPCGDCGIELEVVGIDPLTVEQAPEVEEDWGE